mmetsp:Transcript_30385/g.70442  ORF Transcript_30385/g.70442 Transcript_30385/m.70442 type:complete len:210 (-) Transcript_30385:39-668(-)|eukprot:CAMPEP_0182600062 /NCGR_PEP_ID=MMETSP1324-20130603/90796_1 /TAXON_ID=236786 /ORGANISM="Florenciella sp., Strain RCC1587" /LENGTH=209 /DNA_ID=CAMNT_0024817971 /DNA_START=39 /DNA_END=668 /DNA_ORIENTATION=-
MATMTMMILALLATGTTAFAPAGAPTRTRAGHRVVLGVSMRADGDDAVATSRRSFGQGLVGTFSLGLGLGLGLTTSPEEAAALPVGEGGLPDGAKQFESLVRAKREWNKLGKSIATRHEEYSAEEWKNVALFLRQLYSTGDDMNFMARSFDKTKRGEATELIKRFQDRVKGAAPAADKKDWEELLAVQKDTIGDINKFFDLLIDAPEDL